MFNPIKTRKEERIREQQELKEAVEAEKQRLAQKRSEAKKSSFRRIQLVDKIGTRIDEKKDEEELNRFKASEEKRLARERSERNKIKAKSTWKRIGIGFLALCVIYGAKGAIEDKVKETEDTKNYPVAVQDIVDGNYSEGRSMLIDNEVEDSLPLSEYASLRENASSYQGNIKGYYNDIRNIKGITNTEVKEQYDEYVAFIGQLVDLQDKIDQINLRSIYTIEEDVTSIGQLTDSLDEEYVTLLDTNRLETAQKIVENIKGNTEVGQLMIAIEEMEDITLDSKEAIDNLLIKYDSLSEAEKEEVINSDWLQIYNRKYNDLVVAKEKAEQEAREREEAERLAREKAEQEAREAEERARQEEIKRAQEEYSWYHETVYTTPSKNRYHYEWCSTIRNSTLIPLTRQEAINAGIPSCGHCKP